MINPSLKNVLNSLKKHLRHFLFLFLICILHFKILKPGHPFEKNLIDTVSMNQAKEDTVRPVY